MDVERLFDWFLKGMVIFLGVGFGIFILVIMIAYPLVPGGLIFMILLGYIVELLGWWVE